MKKVDLNRSDAGLTLIQTMVIVGIVGLIIAYFASKYQGYLS